jgi:hypothetical protein
MTTTKRSETIEAKLVRVVAGTPRIGQPIEWRETWAVVEPAMGGGDCIIRECADQEEAEREAALYRETAASTEDLSYEDHD